MMRNTKNTERGFSLLEMMMVLAILSLVLAVTMTAINDVQKRVRVEESKVDLTQESREFVEQMVRDLHQSGYPTTAMFTAVPATDSIGYAAGLVAASTTSIWFEGDVDGDGQVDVVQYNLVTSTGVPAGQCPCTLQRGAVAKIVGLPLAQPAPQFNQQVNGVINSAGGLANSWVIAGTTGPVTHDVRYASYKTDPIFRYYDQFGCELTPAAAAATNAAFNIVVTATCTAAPKTVADVRAIRITVNALSTVIDAVTQTFPASSMTASARIANK
jgi:prepilin-type N-terminal cleavage/methylation domain-containing protein